MDMNTQGRIFESLGLALRRDSSGTFALQHASPEGRTHTFWLYSDSDNADAVMSDRRCDDASASRGLEQVSAPPATVVPLSTPLRLAWSGSLSSLSSLTSLTSSSSLSSLASISSSASASAANPHASQAPQHPVVDTAQPSAEPPHPHRPLINPQNALSRTYSASSLFDGPLTPLPSHYGSDNEEDADKSFPPTGLRLGRNTASDGKQEQREGDKHNHKQEDERRLRSHLTGTMSSLTSIPSSLESGFAIASTNDNDHDTDMHSPNASPKTPRRLDHSPSFDDLARGVAQFNSGQSSSQRTDPGIPTERCFNVEGTHRIQLEKMLGRTSRLGNGAVYVDDDDGSNDMVLSPPRNSGVGPIRKNTRNHNPLPSPVLVSTSSPAPSSPSRSRRSGRTSAYPQPPTSTSSSSSSSSPSSSSPHKPPSSKTPRAAAGVAKGRVGAAGGGGGGGGWKGGLVGPNGRLGDYRLKAVNYTANRAASVASQSSQTSHATAATEIVDPDQQFAPRPVDRRELSPTLVACVSTALVSHPTLLLDA